MGGVHAVNRRWIAYGDQAARVAQRPGQPGHGIRPGFLRLHPVPPHQHLGRDVGQWNV